MLNTDIVMIIIIIIIKFTITFGSGAVYDRDHYVSTLLIALPLSVDWHWLLVVGGMSRLCLITVKAQQEPTVRYTAAGDDTLYTLMMTNPDGHLFDDEGEYIHWLL